MTETKIKLGFAKLKKALAALELMSCEPMQDNRGNIDATIQRFEFTIELFWKLLKHILESKGTLVRSPKDVLQEAYMNNLIDDEKQWIKMLDDRNLSSHTYDEKLADEIYARIKNYVPILKKTFENLERMFDREL